MMSKTDVDAAKYLSFILVEYNSNWPVGIKNEISVMPVFIDDINQLYDPNEIVNVMDKNHPIDNNRVQACLQRNLEIKF
jgi:hypothetical protein